MTRLSRTPLPSTTSTSVLACPVAHRGRRLDDDRRHDGRRDAQCAGRGDPVVRFDRQPRRRRRTGRRADVRNHCSSLTAIQTARPSSAARAARPPRPARRSTTSTTTTAGPRRRRNIATARRFPIAPTGGNASWSRASCPTNPATSSGTDQGAKRIRVTIEYRNSACWPINRRSAPIRTRSKPCVGPTK